ncbi:MAG: electron transfer flavoprotein subunit beta, partial [Syntrophomonadaceae bacterium]|nr:electron transfer flavoprotein subunit beta [Syntrophomonadaceae bacterium]
WNEPRYPSMKGIMAAKKKPVATVAGKAVANVTNIVEFALPAAKQAGVKIEDDPDVAATKLADWMKNTVKVEIK